MLEIALSCLFDAADEIQEAKMIMQESEGNDL